MKTTVCIALIVVTLAVLLHFSQDSFAEAARSRSSRSRGGSSYSRRRGGSYSSRRRSGGTVIVGGSARIALIVVGSLVGLGILVWVCRCMCREEDTGVVTVSQNPVAVTSTHNTSSTWENKQNVPAYSAAYTNGGENVYTNGEMPPVYSAGTDTVNFNGEAPGYAYPPPNAAGAYPPAAPGAAYPPAVPGAVYPPPNAGVYPPPAGEAAAVISYPPPAAQVTVTGEVGAEPASNPYANAGVTWQSPSVAPPNDAPPPTYGDVTN